MGNDYGNEVTAGRYDALNGLVLLGDGTGHFSAQTILQSGFYVPGDAKALVALRDANGNELLAATQNRGPIKVFKNNTAGRTLLAVQPADRAAILTLANGKQRKQELYYGSSFLSQQGRFVEKTGKVKSIDFINAKGEKRRAE